MLNTQKKRPCSVTLDYTVLKQMPRTFRTNSRWFGSSRQRHTARRPLCCNERRCAITSLERASPQLTHSRSASLVFSLMGTQCKNVRTVSASAPRPHTSPSITPSHPGSRTICAPTNEVLVYSQVSLSFRSPRYIYGVKMIFRTIEVAGWWRLASGKQNADSEHENI